MAAGIGLGAAIALAIAARAVSQDAQVSVTYEGVPESIGRIQVLEWREGDPPTEVAATIDRRGRTLAIKALPGFQRVVVVHGDDGRYLIDGPFSWPDADRTRPAPPEWRFTVTGTLSADVPLESVLTWISAHEDQAGWPRCIRAAERRWQCWGVRSATRGILALSSPSSFGWALVDGRDASPLHNARWGRMVTTYGTETTEGDLRVVFNYPVAPPAERMASLRLDTAPVNGAEVVRLSANTIWVSASAAPPLAWAEVRADAAGPVYLSLAELSEGPSALPVLVRLPPRRLLAGITKMTSGEAVAGAMVTLFRAIDLPAPPGSAVRPRRVFVSEKVTDAEGMFSIDGLGEADYEVVAWHPQLGRASAVLSPAQTSVSMILQAAGSARGRVLASGKPLEGVDVISVPDTATFNAVKDLTEARGGDARTGPDGRFSVAIASTGGGELRIGGGTYAVKRVPLPRPAVAILDLGDIELAAAIDVTIVLDRDVGCGVRAIGPVGRTGLQIITAVRSADGAFALSIPEPGLWQFGLVCTGEKHAIAPSSVQISAANAGKELRFMVR